MNNNNEKIAYIIKYSLFSGKIAKKKIIEERKDTIKYISKFHKFLTGNKEINYYYGENVEYCYTLEKALEILQTRKKERMQELRSQLTKLENIHFDIIDFTE